MEARAVKPGNLGGERCPHTRSISVDMAVIGADAMKEADLRGATAIGQPPCRIAFKPKRHDA